MVQDRYRSGQPRITTRRPDATLTAFFVLWHYFLRQIRKRVNFIYQHDNAPAHTARLTVNFQVTDIIFVLDRPPLSQDMSAIKLLIATSKSQGIAI